MARIPLAWLQLTHEKLRLAAALAGIAFAVILMMLQLGFAAALIDSAVLVYGRLNADLFLVSPNFEYILQTKTIPRHRLYQSLTVEGVDSVTPFYVSLATWKHPVDLKETSLLVVGFDPASRAFSLPGVEQNLQHIQLPDVVLFDSASHPKFGPVPALLDTHAPVYTEINHRRVRIGGLFRLGIGFAAIGNVVTSELNFLRLFPGYSQDRINLGLIRLKPGADTEHVRQQLRSMLPDDVLVLSRDQFMDTEKGFWNTVSPIGFIFGMGVFMGFMVGSIIVYQILYTDVSDHLAEYATLKAIGYRDSFLFAIVFKEALLLSLLGYIPGLAISQGLYILTAQATGLPISLTWQRAAAVFVFTIIMCTASGALAMRRIRSADPAEIF
jgi:putative ABC transport system permease protein